jgi:hypothetical protein
MDAIQNLLSHNSGQLTVWIVLILVIVVLVPFYKMMKASTEFRDRAVDAIKTNSAGSLALAVKRSGGGSLVVRLNKDAVQMARDLFRDGNDLESVCRKIEPAYANWRIVQQQALRRAIEMVLTAEPTA